MDAELESLLAERPEHSRASEAILRVERAVLLGKMGRTAEAQAEHLRVVEMDPPNRTNLLELGLLLVRTNNKRAARIIYEELLQWHPADLLGLVNLGSVLLEEGETEAARARYEEALAIDPESAQANGGMYYALRRMGQMEDAERYQRKAFGRQNVFPLPYKGEAPPIPVVLLLASTGGNTPIETLLDDTVFQRTVVIADFFDPATALPRHQLIVNGIGDAEVSQPALMAAKRLIAQSSAMVLNRPCAVLATGRCENALRMAALPGVRTAATVLLPYAVLAEERGAEALAERGFRFPLLLRAPGFHMGKHFVRVERAAELAVRVATLPGAGVEGAELLAIELLDARGADGSWRKYRVMMVGGRLYPLHLAISQNWKIHYFNADMADRPDHRAEEARFLADMEGALGTKAVRALEAVQATLGLDYGGADFGVDAQGNLLLFEANAAMVVEQPDKDERWDYRRSAVARIHAAVMDLLRTSARSDRRRGLTRRTTPGGNDVIARPVSFESASPVFTLSSLTESASVQFGAPPQTMPTQR
jgi:tetratricopeptide (TPR) repeat protein